MENSERARIGKMVKSSYDYTKKQFDNECKAYVKMYRHEMSGMLPSRLLQSDNLDVNVVFPVVKSLIPNLYFKDPQVFCKAEQEKIFAPVTQLDPQTNEIVPIIDPTTGDPVMQEYDGPHSALIMQSTINQNLYKAKAKRQIKDVIMDAHLTFYGAVKTGWGNEQGVASMGDSGIPSIREDIFDNMAYVMRLKPWNVCVDLMDFYNPAWKAIRWTVHPSQLKQDKRLKNTETIVGNYNPDQEDRETKYKHVDPQDLKQVEYFEVYMKPCAQYPKGKFYMFTDEVKDDFIFESDWPIQAKESPVKLMYFNPDPYGGFPVPDVRLYANHQKAKLNMRNAEYEWVQRIIPIMGIDLSGVKNASTVEKQITSGQIPRVVATTRSPQRVLGGVSYPSLNADFRTLEMNIDTDITRMVGMISPSVPASQGQDQLATALKIASAGEQIRQNERADIVSDFLQEIVDTWFKFYQEFAGPDNYVTLDGEKFPTKWTKEQINGKFIFKIKPFSMSYEDPSIRRKQWTDLLNLLAAPETRMALAEQGAQVDILKIINRILETYDERDVESFVIDDMSKPENQVAMAIQENQVLIQAAMTGIPAVNVRVQPTDNHKLHILIHGLAGDASFEHMQEHNMVMMQAAGAASAGGGNKEGLPVNGVGVKQDLVKSSGRPSTANKKTAIKREATKV